MLIPQYLHNFSTKIVPNLQLTGYFWFLKISIIGLVPLQSIISYYSWIAYCLGTNGDKLFDGNTPVMLYEGNYTLHSKKFSQHIFPANVYMFSLKLVAPSELQQTTDDNYIIKEMESEEVTVQCYSKPSEIFGLYNCRLIMSA